MTSLQSTPFRVTVALVAALVLSAIATPARAAGDPLALTVDGRPLSHAGSVAQTRHGVAYVDLVEIVRTFDGLLSIHKADTVATIGHHEATFRANDARVKLDGATVRMPAAAFRSGGDLYVPLTFLVRGLLPGATVRIDRAHHRATIHVRHFSHPRASATP